MHQLLRSQLMESLWVAALLAGGAAAQGSGDATPPGAPAGPPRAVAAPPRPAPQRIPNSEFIGDDGVTSIRPDTGVPQPDGAARARRSGSEFVTYRLSTRPSRLAPGQEGELVVTALLHRDAVHKAESEFDLFVTTAPPQLTLGGPSLRAAVAATQGAFRGRLVHEELVIASLPLTVDANAVPGTELAVALTVQTDLHDGTSGQRLGPFEDQVEGAFRVATPLPGARELAPPPSVAPAGQALPVVAPQAAEPAADPEPDGIAPVPAPYTSWILAGAGAALLLGLALMLAQRRR